MFYTNPYRKVDDAVRKMPYLHHFIGRFHLNSPYSSLHAPWPAASQKVINGAFTSGDQRISVSVSRPSSGSTDTVCGWKLRFTVESDGKVATLDSTVGGLIVVNGALYGLTTAHGIINYILNSRRDMSLTESESEEEASDSTDTESDDTSDSALDVAYKHSTPASIIAIGVERSAHVVEDTFSTWTELELPKVLVYLDRGTTVGDYSLTSLTTASNQADFLLVNLEPINVSEQRNMIYNSEHAMFNPIDDHIRTHDLVHGEVHIITGNNGRSMRGQLLEGDASLILRGTIIRTRKIQVDCPGGE
jgi:hypothetical protein